MQEGISGGDEEIGVPAEVRGILVDDADARELSSGFVFVVVALDGDGVVVVPIERAAQVLEASQVRDEREASLRVKLQAGQLTYDLHGLRSFVEGQK